MTEIEKLEDLIKGLVEKLPMLVTSPPSRSGDVDSTFLETIQLTLEDALEEAESALNNLEASDEVTFSHALHELEILRSTLSQVVTEAAQEIERLHPVLNPLGELVAKIQEHEADVYVVIRAFAVTMTEGVLRTGEETGDLEDRSTETKETLGATWHTLSSDFQALADHLASAAIQVDKQAFEVVPAAAFDAQSLGGETVQAIEKLVYEQIEKACSDALTHVLEDVLQSIDHMVTALISAIEEFASEAEVHGGTLEGQASIMLADISTIASLLEEVGQEALSVPHKVAVKIATIGGGGW